MPSKLLLKRGRAASLASLTLAEGEPAFVSDTGKLYIGISGGKALINDIDKPAGINVSNFYTKVRVNSYGQVVEQSLLGDSDFPAMPISKVLGLGTGATANVGVAAGQVPLLDASGKLPISIMPPPNSQTAYSAYYSGVNQVVLPTEFIKCNREVSPQAGYVINADGSVGVLVAGTYYIAYVVSSNTIELNVNLGSPGLANVWAGTVCRTTASGSQPYSMCGASTIKAFPANAKIAARNNGTSNAIILDGMASLTVIKLF